MAIICISIIISAQIVVMLMGVVETDKRLHCQWDTEQNRAGQATEVGGLHPRRGSL